MILPTGIRANVSRPARRGFTLIELIVVMMVMASVLAVVAPQLSSFFRGRTLESEARRILALTRLGQSRAVSEGVPMILWIDQRTRSYGLRAQDGYTAKAGANDSAWQALSYTGVGKNLSFTLDENLGFLLQPAVRAQKAQTAAGPTTVVPPSRNLQTQIRFLPDGSIGEESLATVVVRQNENDWIAVGQADNRLSYEMWDKSTIRRPATH